VLGRCEHGNVIGNQRKSIKHKKTTKLGKAGMHMRRPNLRPSILLIIVFIMLFGCQFADNEPYLSFKNHAGDTLMTDMDLETLKVVSLLDGGGRGFYIVPKDKNKIEEMTTKAFNNSIEIYYKNDLIYSSKVNKVTKGINLVFNDMDEETLKRMEQILQENK
jgi:hypothetical protein